jgi:cytochrome P450
MTQLFSDEMRRNPYPVYEQIRSASPVFFDEQSGLWMLFEEVLRFRSPLQWVYRVTRRDVEMHGLMIPAGRLLGPTNLAIRVRPAAPSAAMPSSRRKPAAV